MELPLQYPKLYTLFYWLIAVASSNFNWKFIRLLTEFAAKYMKNMVLKCFTTPRLSKAGYYKGY